MRWILSIVLVLSMCLACGNDRMSDEQYLASRLDFWTRQVVVWRNQGVAQDVSDSVEALRNDLKRSQGLDYRDLGTSESELNSFIRQGRVADLKLRWAALLQQKVERLSREEVERKIERPHQALYLLMRMYGISATELGYSSDEPLVRFHQAAHAQQAQYALTILYRYPTEPTSDYDTPRELVAHVSEELEAAGIYGENVELVESGPVTEKHAKELADLAYMRMIGKIMTQLRNKVWEYPDSMDMVNRVAGIRVQAGLTYEDIGTSVEELILLSRVRPSPTRLPSVHAE